MKFSAHRGHWNRFDPTVFMKPVIGITSTAGEDKIKPYVDTIRAHDAEPLVLRLEDDFRQASPAAVLLTGGGDLSERFYDHPLSPSERKTLGTIEPERETYEFDLLEWATKNRVPVLGICRGCQMLNVFAKGTLIPDIPAWQEARKVTPVLQHRADENPSVPAHPVFLEPKSQLSRIFGSSHKLEVNSSHHQALSLCGPGLRVVSRSEDGIVEAVEDPNHPFWIGVQFHPERMWKKFPEFSNLFREFTEHARQMAR